MICIPLGDKGDKTSTTTGEDHLPEFKPTFTEIREDFDSQKLGAKKSRNGLGISTESPLKVSASTRGSIEKEDARILSSNQVNSVKERLSIIFNDTSLFL